MFTTITSQTSSRGFAGTTTPRRLAASSIPLLAASFALTACTELEPEVVTETLTETVTEEVEIEVEVEPADLEEQREAADARDEELDTRETELEEWAEELEDLEGELETREENVSATELEIEENTIPGDGTFFVGEDVEPGTYRSLNETGGCYWARLPGTGGTSSDRITNDFTRSGPSIVTIGESDVAFETSSCGEWIKQ